MIIRVQGLPPKSKHDRTWKGKKKKKMGEKKERKKKDIETQKNPVRTYFGIILHWRSGIEPGPLDQ